MSSDPDVKLESFQCLIDIGKLFYSLMNEDYMNAIINLTSKAMACDDPNIVVISCEFWNVIAEEEKEIIEYNDINKCSGANMKKIFNFVTKYLMTLLKGLTDILLKYEDEDTSDSGKSIHDAAFKCLMAINDITKDIGFDQLVQFVNMYILENDETKRIASIIVFSSMVETMPSEKMNDFVNKGFGKFLEYLNDKNLRVRYAVSDL